MKNFRNWIKNELPVHLVAALLLLLSAGFGTAYIFWYSPLLFSLNMLVKAGLLLLLVYLNYFLFIPRVFRTGRYVLYFSILASCFVVYFLSSYLIGNYVADVMKSRRYYPSWDMLFAFFDFCRYVVIGFLLFSLKEKIDQKRMMEQIQLEKLTTEVNYLKAQINPHFLFNTLNNLYGLALERSDKTPAIIMHLSRIMDYMLYDSGEPEVYLKKDIENLENYIMIEKIRQGNNAVINFVTEGDIGNRKIVPLLFLPLVENGFKHGVNTLIEDARLDVRISVLPDAVECAAVNSYRPVEESGREGIGLKNLERRLNLFYPGRHTLRIEKETNEFRVYLKIMLA